MPLGALYSAQGSVMSCMNGLAGCLLGFVPARLYQLFWMLVFPFSYTFILQTFVNNISIHHYDPKLFGVIVIWSFLFSGQKICFQINAMEHLRALYGSDVAAAITHST